MPIGSDDLVFLPHLMVGERAPYWDEHLRGGFLGLGVYHTQGAHVPQHPRGGRLRYEVQPRSGVGGRH